MANLQNLIVSASLNLLPTVENTGSYGYIWYDQASCLLKYSTRTVKETITTGGDMVLGRCNLGGAGIPEATLAFGGIATPSARATTERYDGTTWASANDMTTPRFYHVGTGTQDAALAAGGLTTPAVTGSVEVYDGTNWSVAAPLDLARYGSAGGGTQDATLIFGGNFPRITCTQEYDGATWSTRNSMTRGRQCHIGDGNPDAAWASAGGPSRATEVYDGTTWSEVACQLCALYLAAGAGTVNDAGSFGGQSGPSYLRCVEFFDGTTWCFGYNMLDNTCIFCGQATGCPGTGTLVFGGSQSPSCSARTTKHTYIRSLGVKAI